MTQEKRILAIKNYYEQQWIHYTKPATPEQDDRPTLIPPPVVIDELRLKMIEP